MLHNAHTGFLSGTGFCGYYEIAAEVKTYMNELGRKIAEKRRDRGITQTAFAERLCVSRQTVSRWEAGTVLPDIAKISDIADILGVSCDYLLKDDVKDDTAVSHGAVGALLRSAEGRTVKFSFFDGEADVDLYDVKCRIVEFAGSWMKVEAQTKKGTIEKLIPVSSVLSIEFTEEAE